jgi:hypothetical protein
VHAPRSLGTGADMHISTLVAIAALACALSLGQALACGFRYDRRAGVWGLHYALTSLSLAFDRSLVVAPTQSSG